MRHTEVCPSRIAVREYASYCTVEHELIRMVQLLSLYKWMTDIKNP